MYVLKEITRINPARKIADVRKGIARADENSRPTKLENEFPATRYKNMQNRANIDADDDREPQLTSVSLSVSGKKLSPPFSRGDELHEIGRSSI